MRELIDETKSLGESKSRIYEFRLHSSYARLRRMPINAIDTYNNSGSSSRYYESLENRAYGGGRRSNSGRLRRRTNNRRRVGDRGLRQFYDDDKDHVLSDRHDNGDSSLNHWRRKFRSSKKLYESQIDEYDYEVETKIEDNESYRSNSEEAVQKHRHDFLQELSDSQSRSPPFKILSSENQHLIESKSNRRKLYTKEAHQSVSTSVSDV